MTDPCELTMQKIPPCEMQEKTTMQKIPPSKRQRLDTNKESFASQWLALSIRET